MSVKLHQFPAAFGLPSASPFCVKVATYLRMANQPYTPVVGDPRRAPKGKLPVLEDKGQLIADSDFIIRYLKSRGHDLDEHLDSRQAALGTAVRRMIEEHLYWAMLYSRWLDEPSWSHAREVFFKSLPIGVRGIVSRLVRRQVKNDLRGHGMGRHSREEIYDFGRDDLDKLSILLGDHSYFLGDRPSSLDATAYAFLACILVPEVRTPLTDAAEAHRSLVDYVSRMREAYYAG
jgi:glutathione S-transferase